MQLQKAVALFLGEHIPTTAQSYTYPLKCLCKWADPTRELESIRSDLLLEYVQAIIKPRHYAAATELKHIKTIKVFFNWCTRVDFIPKSPARALHTQRPMRRVSRDKAMTDEELVALLDYLRYKANPRDYALVLFLADTGCRRGGVAGLRLQDVDFDKLVAVVTEKGNQTRPVAFSQKCATALIHWLAYRSAHYKIKGVFVFSRDGQKIKAENYSLAIRRACKKIGSRVRSTHSLRHRKGHQFADHRIAPSYAATALGHSDVLITIQSYYPDDWAGTEAALRELMTDAPSLPKVLQFHAK